MIEYCSPFALTSHHVIGKKGELLSGSAMQTVAADDDAELGEEGEAVTSQERIRDTLKKSRVNLG